MIDYLGTPKDELISLIKETEAFMRSLNLGPAVTQELDNWSAKKPYEALAAATTRKDLADAMSKTGTGGAFIRSIQVLQYHAIVNTGGTAKKMYEDLCNAGVVSGAMTMDYKPSDAERDLHLVKCYAEKLREEEQMGADIPRTAQLFMEMTEERLAETFLAGDLRARHKIKEELYTATNLEAESMNLHITTPFDRYGISVLDLSDENTRVTTDMRKMYEDIAPMMPLVDAALAPFRETGEVQMTMMGMITDDWKNVGLAFVATRPAAEAVAKALPQMTVVNSNGQRLLPPAPKAAAKKPNGPKP